MTDTTKSPGFGAISRLGLDGSPVLSFSLRDIDPRTKGWSTPRMLLGALAGVILGCALFVGASLYSFHAVSTGALSLQQEMTDRRGADLAYSLNVLKLEAVKQVQNGQPVGRVQDGDKLTGFGMALEDLQGLMTGRDSMPLHSSLASYIYELGQLQQSGGSKEVLAAGLEVAETRLAVPFQQGIGALGLVDAGRGFGLAYSALVGSGILLVVVLSYGQILLARRTGRRFSVGFIMSAGMALLLLVAAPTYLWNFSGRQDALVHELGELQRLKNDRVRLGDSIHEWRLLVTKGAAPAGDWLAESKSALCGEKGMMPRPACQNEGAAAFIKAAEEKHVALVTQVRGIEFRILHNLQKQVVSAQRMRTIFSGGALLVAALALGGIWVRLKEYA